MGGDNKRWVGPGHYWKGYPCANPRNCQYGPGGAGTLNDPFYTRPTLHTAGGLTVSDPMPSSTRKKSPSTRPSRPTAASRTKAPTQRRKGSTTAAAMQRKKKKK